MHFVGISKPAAQTAGSFCDSTPGTRNFTVPPGVTTLTKVRCWGAGGAGADQAGSVPGGGGGGGYSEITNIAVTPEQLISYTVGVGGTPTFSQATAPAGGDSTVGTPVNITAHGGGGGSETLTGGAGGTATGGTTNNTGGSGGNGVLVGNGNSGGGGGAAGPDGAGIAGANGASSGTQCGAGGAGDNGSGGSGGSGGQSTLADNPGMAGGNDMNHGGGGGGGGLSTVAFKVAGGAGGNPGGGGGGGNGTTGNTGGTGGNGQVCFTWGGTNQPPPPPLNAFYVSPTNGNDSNPGTRSLPFATLGQGQTAVAGQPANGTRTVVLLAGSGGTYTFGTTFTINTANITFQFDPISGLRTATITGSGQTPIIDIRASNVTIKGIRVTNGGQMNIATNGGGSGSATLNNVIIDSCELDNTTSNDGGAAADGAATISNCKNAQVINCYVHDCNDVGISVIAFNSGDSFDGCLVQGNCVLNTITASNIADSGAIYLNARNTLAAGGGVTIKNNFVRDYGNTSAQPVNGSDFQAIYLDDSTAGCTITGNICGPPTSGVPVSGFSNNSAMMLFNGGHNNSATNNIVDLGFTSRQITALWVGGTNTFSNNIILSNFNGGLNTSASGVTGFAYYNGGGTISNNFYHNYASGSSTFSNGSSTGDSNPVAGDPMITGYLYNIAAGSPVFNSPVNFVDVTAARSAGPSGFSIPTSTNHSD